MVTIEDEEEEQQDESDFGEASHIEASDIDPPEFIVHSSIKKQQHQYHAKTTKSYLIVFVISTPLL